MLSKKRPLTKWSCVVHWNSRSTLSTTSKKARQIIERTSVCVSIYLECWFNKARAEIVTWAAVGVACQQQFSYNSVSKFWQCERNRCGLNSHSMRIEWMRIQFAFKQDQVWKGLNMLAFVLRQWYCHENTNTVYPWLSEPRLWILVYLNSQKLVNFLWIS